MRTIGATTPVGKGKEKKVKKETGKKFEAEDGLWVLKLAKVPKRARLLQLASSSLTLRTLGTWTFLLLRRKSAILLSQRSE